MKRILNTAGWGSVYFATSTSVAILILRFFILEELFNHPLEIGSPGGGIAFVLIWLFIMVTTIMLLGWFASKASAAAPKIEAWVPARYRSVGWIGLLLFAEPFLLGWWLFQPHP